MRPSGIAKRRPSTPERRHCLIGWLRLRMPARPRGGVVTQRSAKPFTPVQFRAWPPTISRTYPVDNRGALLRVNFKSTERPCPGLPLIVFSAVVMLVALLAGWFAPLQHSFNQRWVAMPAAMSWEVLDRAMKVLGTSFVLHALQVPGGLSFSSRGLGLLF